jgi:hypothetical protein
MWILNRGGQDSAGQMSPSLEASRRLEQLSSSDASALGAQTHAHAVRCVRNHAACASAGTTANCASASDERLYDIYIYIYNWGRALGHTSVDTAPPWEIHPP